MVAWLALAATAASTALNYKASTSAQKAQNQQIAYENEAAWMNYQLALEDRAMVAAQREEQKQYQAAATQAELIRQERAETGARINQFHRSVDRALANEEVQRQSLGTRGTAQARAGAAGVSGVSISAITRSIEGAAARYIGSSQVEAKRDAALTDLGIEDSRIATAQRLISINQPLGGIPGVAPPQIRPEASSSSFLNFLSAATTGLQVYGSLRGTFGSTKGKSALPTT